MFAVWCCVAKSYIHEIHDNTRIHTSNNGRGNAQPTCGMVIILGLLMSSRETRTVVAAVASAFAAVAVFFIVSEPTSALLLVTPVHNK